ncbi:RCC1 and BTB domain-containing protein 2 [Entomortierella lignicola]|nr:RCC1 and BTB domain-containing protein 2 [Entomortierella lignicola]
MPSNHGSSQYLHHSQQILGASNSAYNFQAQGGSTDASIVPRPTQGDRMSCIVNASITCIPSFVTFSGQDSFKRNTTAQEYSGTISDSRSGSSQGYHQSQNRQDSNHEHLQLYVFGGFHQYTDAVNNDLYRLDIDTMHWERLIYTKGEPPSKRNDHSASLWGNDRIVIFGGSDERNLYCNDVQILHVPTLTWESPEVSGIIPSGRVKHAATIMNDRLYVSGGCLEQEGVSQELLCLNLLTWEWEEPIDFVPRYRHTLFVHRDKLFAYGGYNEEMDRTGVIAYMDLDTNQVTKVNVSNDIAPNVAAQQFSQVCGNHLVVVISQGVRHELQKFTGGIWTLNLDCFQWTMHDDWKILGESHTWHYFSMERDGDQFHLIGDVNDSDEYFKQVLTIDMREYGSFKEPEVAIGSEFGRLLQDQMSLADFRIICTGTDAQVNAAIQSAGPFSGYYAPSDSSGDHDMMIDNHPMIMSQRVRSQRQTPSTSRPTSPHQEPIMCHKLILLARWPHFASMVQSGMIEAQTSTLTLPEPYETVKAFIEYLYTDSIEGMSTDTVADLLVMGSMYVMKRLVQLCISVLHQQIDIETVSRIYHRAGLSGQIGLRQRALKFMFGNYGPVSKTIGFRSLPKEALFDFWDSTPEGAVINVAVYPNQHLS